MSDAQKCAECNCDHGGVYCNWMYSSPRAYKAEMESLRAEVERLKGGLEGALADSARLTLALSDERRHADALAEALKAAAGCLDGFPATAEAHGVDRAAIRAAKSAEDYDESLGEAIAALDQHRARRQGDAL